MSTITNRIKNVQKNLKVPQTGVFDMATCIAYDELVLMINVNELLSLKDHIKVIQRKLGFHGNDVDGLIGPISLTQMEIAMIKELPPLPASSSLIVTQRGIDMIIKYEIGSKASYESTYNRPIWPGGSSGVTIGFGYDLAHHTSAAIATDWSPYLSSRDIQLLQSVSGKRGAAAENSLSSDLKKIRINWQAAREIFYMKSAPKYAKLTAGIYPGLAKLPPDAQAAILSLVYNRGTSLVGESREEMKNIVLWVKNKNLKKIADEIRAMKRLWSYKTQKGLHFRRNEEADMVENSNYFFSPSELIFL